MWIRKDAVYKNVSEHRFNTQYKAIGFEPVPEETKEPENQPVEKPGQESTPAAELPKDSGVFTCPVCRKKYKTERGLATHMKTHEDGEQDA